MNGRTAGPIIITIDSYRRTHVSGIFYFVSVSVAANHNCSCQPVVRFIGFLAALATVITIITERIKVIKILY